MSILKYKGNILLTMKKYNTKSANFWKKIKIKNNKGEYE